MSGTVPNVRVANLIKIPLVFAFKDLSLLGREQVTKHSLVIRMA